MKTKSTFQSAFFNLRIAIGFALCLTGVLLTLVGFSKSITGTSDGTNITALTGLTTQPQNTRYHHFHLVDMGTLGGANAFVGSPITNLINRQGTAVAEADTTIPDPYAPNCFQVMFGECLVNHNLQWKNGRLTDLGTLPGVNSSFPSWINDQGVVTGFSENSMIDPLTGFPETRAVIWANGQVIDLGTLGGNASVANAISNRNQVVGAALNTIADPFGNSFLPFPFFFFGIATQAHAFSWTRENGMQDLGTLGSGLDSQAFLVNENGQVAGVSFTSSNPRNTGPACFNANIPRQDPFIWTQADGMTDLGSLGGHCGWPFGSNNAGMVVGDSANADDALTLPFLWTRQTGIQALSTTSAGSLGGEAYAINNAGQIVGYGQNVNEAFALLWENGTVRRLGNLAGANCTIANSINSHGQVVGYSGPGFPQGDCTGRAVFWEKNGPPADLNLLIHTNSPLQLFEAISINDRGEIIGNATLPNGDWHPYLAIPCDENHPNVEGCDYSLVDVNAATFAAPVAQSLVGANRSHPRLTRAAMLTPRPAHSTQRTN